MLLTGHVLCKLIFPTTLACKLENTKEKHPQCIFLKFIIGVCYGECDLPGAGFEKKDFRRDVAYGTYFFQFFWFPIFC